MARIFLISWTQFYPGNFYQGGFSASILRDIIDESTTDSSSLFAD